ncbi:hypothetical protein Fot_52053 [Forsythia ovata]|uniref:Uncharacterized protein n=1 Tax=Forsythia ovata TaxID=205694 RepID=A0ABD1PJL9_9LAMI
MTIVWLAKSRECPMMSGRNVATILSSPLVKAVPMVYVEISTGWCKDALECLHRVADRHGPVIAEAPGQYMLCRRIRSLELRRQWNGSVVNMENSEGGYERMYGMMGHQIQGQVYGAHDWSSGASLTGTNLRARDWSSGASPAGANLRARDWSSGASPAGATDHHFSRRSSGDTDPIYVLAPSRGHAKI